MIDNFENEYSESQGLITDAGWAEIETTDIERMLRELNRIFFPHPSQWDTVLFLDKCEDPMKITLKKRRLRL